MELWQTMGERAARLMQSRAGRNGYTQGSKRKYFWGYPDNEVGNTSQAGYSDCSSAARSAILAAAGIDIGSNTNAQIKNRAKGQIVHETEGYYPDESQLLPGDYMIQATACQIDNSLYHASPDEAMGYGYQFCRTQHNAFAFDIHKNTRRSQINSNIL